MSPALKRWLIGLGNAALSGLIGATGAAYAGTTGKQAAIIALGCAVGSISKWLPQHPIPGSEDTK